MANSRFEYVKSFELEDRLLPHCWIVFRIDGKGFTKFCDAHHFQKPNDSRALLLANTAAKMLMEEHSEIVLGYGQSDEYSFVLRKNTELYNRRSSKLISVFVSYYTAAYVSQWPTHFPGVPLQYLPSFDGRTVCYPSNEILRDYLSWRQADCHINNQYNTCFWALVHSGKTPAEAQEILKGTLTEHKNALLHDQFHINYNDLDPLYRKGSIVLRKREMQEVKQKADGTPVMRERSKLVVIHDDMIRDRFWQEHPHLLCG